MAEPAILGLFFLQVPVGTGVGEVTSAKIEGMGPDITSGLGQLPDKRPVVVENIVAADDKDKPEVADTPEAKAKLAAFLAANPEEREEKKLGEGLGSATKFWAVFEESRKKYDDATEEQRKEKKLKDPRFVTTFLVLETQGKSGWIIGDGKVPLAPFWPFFLLMFIHCIFYVPTISITNSIAFANLKDPAKEFGPVRVWGTIGWIVASWPFIFILVDWAKVPSMGDVGFVKWLGAALGTSKEGVEASAAQRYIFLVAGLASFILAAISPTLPHTPPKPAAAGGDSLAWLKAARLLKHPFVAVLFLVTFIDAAVHQSFFYWTASFLKSSVGIPANWVPPVMKIGQIAEILTMLCLGYVLKTFGWRTTMIFGVLGHAARFAVFAFYPEPWAAVTVNILHGICYAFFFATVYIFVDEFFPKDTRSSAQGLFNAVIIGVGPFVANMICGQLGVVYKVGDKLNYSAIFQYSMGAAVVGAILLALFFHPPKHKMPDAT